MADAGHAAYKHIHARADHNLYANDHKHPDTDSHSDKYSGCHSDVYKYANENSHPHPHLHGDNDSYGRHNHHVG